MRIRSCRPALGLAVMLVAITVVPASADALVFVKTWGTQGAGPGQFEAPQGVTWSPNGYVYVADTGNYRLQKFDGTGSFAGIVGGFGENGGTGDGEFNFPTDVAADFAGNLYVADSGNNRIQKLGPDDGFLTKWGGAGSAPGRFSYPSGVAISPSGNVYVADSGNSRIQKFDAGGTFIAQWGGPGAGPGGFNSITGLAVDFAGDVYVADSGNDRIQKFDSNGAFVTAWGTTGTSNGQFRTPYDVAVDSSGNVHVSDMNNHRIQSFTGAGVFVQSSGSQGSALGQFQTPTGVAVDNTASVLVADTLNHRVQGSGSGTAIVVTKDAVPNDPQDFTFTTGGFSPSSFELDDDTGSGLPKTRAFGVSPGSGYSVAETVPVGWDQVSATCSDGSPVSNIDVGAGEQVECTFVNQKRGRIVVVQDSQPNALFQFSFTTGGGLSPSSFTLDDDGDNGNGFSNTQTFANVPPGSGYSVSQESESGWSDADVTCSDGSAPDDIDVSPGETVTCTFTNVADNAGRIVVVKDAQPDDERGFAFITGGAFGPSTFSLQDDGDEGDGAPSSKTFIVFPGTGYSVGEDVAIGWVKTSQTCSDGSPISNIEVSTGEVVTCTFVNQKIGRIDIVEDSQPNDPQDFSYTAGGGLSPSSFTLDDDGNSNNGTSNTRGFFVNPGSGYSVSQAAQAGWHTAAACSDGSPLSNIDVAPGEHVTCTFTNRKHGRIVVRKDTEPDDPQDFAFTAGGGLSPASFTLDDDGDSGNGVSNTQVLDGLIPQSGYSVSETAVAGWAPSAACSDGSPTSDIDVAPGETVTCVFTNSKNATLRVVLDTQPDDPQDFSFTADGGLSPSSFTLDDDGDDTNGLASVQTYDVAPSTGFSITQQTVPGWLQESATCSDGSSIAEIDLAPAEDVTCTFVASRAGRIVVVLDARPNNVQPFDFVAGGGLSPSSFQLDDDGDNGNALSDSRAFTVPAGSGYSVAEQGPPPNWTAVTPSCSDGSPASNIDVAQGEIVTCTFVNVLQSYPKPRGASPFRASLVDAYRQCTAPTTMHAAPLAHPSCPFVPASNYITHGSPDANGAGANGQAFITFKVLVQTPGPPDDADVRVTGTLTDVRCRAGTAAAVCNGANSADGPDYSGELQANVSVQITDSFPTGTMVQIPFPMRLTCANVTVTSIGGTCSVSTTFDAIVPGVIRENDRAIWELGAVQVFDGGADGSIQTSDNTLFMSQGLFIP